METHQSSPRAISFELVEWSEQLRSVTSAWLGAVVVAFKSESAPAVVRMRKSLVLIIIIIIIVFSMV